MGLEKSKITKTLSTLLEMRNRELNLPTLIQLKTTELASWGGGGGHWGVGVNARYLEQLIIN
jgi:hypothetical protein